jgi:hypothetical protein
VLSHPLKQQSVDRHFAPLGHITGADPGFQVRGGALKKNCAELREARKLLGYFVLKITILPQKIIFFPILGGAGAPRAPGAPPSGSAPALS